MLVLVVTGARSGARDRVRVRSRSACARRVRGAVRERAVVRGCVRVVPTGSVRPSTKRAHRSRAPKRLTNTEHVFAHDTLQSIYCPYELCGLSKYACSSGVFSRPRTLFRYGYRPKRLTVQ